MFKRDKVDYFTLETTNKDGKATVTLLRNEEDLCIVVMNTRTHSYRITGRSPVTYTTITTEKVTNYADALVTYDNLKDRLEISMWKEVEEIARAARK